MKPKYADKRAEFLGYAPCCDKQNLVIDGAQFKITRLRAESSVKVQLVIGLIEKLVKVKSIDILIAGTTDRAVTEQEVLCVMCVDTETHKPNLSYFEVIEMDKFYQTAPGTGMLAAIKGCFTKHKFSNFGINRSIFLPLELPWIQAKTLISPHKSKQNMTWYCSYGVSVIAWNWH